MRFIKNFQNTTTFSKDYDLITYPTLGDKFRYPNILNNGINTPTKNSENCSNCYNVSLFATMRKGMKLRVEILDANGNAFTNSTIGEVYFDPYLNAYGWVLGDVITGSSKKLPTAMANALVNEVQCMFTPGSNYILKLYENGTNISTKTKTIILP